MTDLQHSCIVLYQVQLTLMIEYVVGFALYEGKVLLIRKHRPSWQADKLNGVGGKIEQGEHPTDSMCREETGIATQAEEWDLFAIVRREDRRVYCFRTYKDIHWLAKSTTDEQVGVYFVADLPLSTLPSVRYLVPLAADYAPKDVVNIHYR